MANQLEQPFIRLYHRNVEIETVDHVAEVDQFRLLGRTLGGDGFALRAEFQCLFLDFAILDHRAVDEDHHQYSNADNAEGEEQVFLPRMRGCFFLRLGLVRILLILLGSLGLFFQ